MIEDLGTTWRAAGVVALTTVAVYVTALVMVRIAGRRTLAQMSAFDAVVTVALGSLVATTAVSAQTTYVQGAVGIGMLLLLQIATAWLRRRSQRFERLIEFPPEVVWRGGEPSLPEGPGSSQLTEDELWSQLRQKGIFDGGGIYLVMLEPSGKFSVARQSDRIDPDHVPPGGVPER